ncbi:MAG: hypothetical protein ABIU20_10700, partial [Blastocatellia bacterium]
MKHQVQREEEAFEEFCREAVYAARADEEVINAAADSPFLFQRVRAQLAVEPKRQASRGFFAALSGGRSPQWAIAVTMVAAVITIAALTRWPGETPLPPDYHSVAEESVKVGPVAIAPNNSPPKSVNAEVSIRRAKSAASPRRASRTEEQEVTTEYLPLTYLAYADDANSGHVVRVQMPRAALLTLGVPVGAEPSAELVKADVIVGDDGLARAIRLVR